MTMAMAKEECEDGNVDIEGESSTEAEAEVLQQLVRLSKELFEFEGKRKDTSLIILRSFQYFCEYRRQL